MLTALIRAAHAADNADCLYQVLVAIAKLASLKGFDAKEKIQLYKMIGELAPKYDERFEDIWQNLVQSSPTPTNRIRPIEMHGTWSDYLGSKTGIYLVCLF